MKRTRKLAGGMLVATVWSFRNFVLMDMTSKGPFEQMGFGNGFDLQKAKYLKAWETHSPPVGGFLPEGLLKYSRYHRVFD